MNTTAAFKPGTIVTGPFFSDGRIGKGEVVAVGRQIWTRVGEGYTPVRIIDGDRANGGYDTDGLSAVPTKDRIIKTDSVTAVAAILDDLGSRIVSQAPAREAGFVTITYTV